MLWRRTCTARLGMVNEEKNKIIKVKSLKADFKKKRYFSQRIYFANLSSLIRLNFDGEEKIRFYGF